MNHFILSWIYELEERKRESKSRQINLSINVEYIEIIKVKASNRHQILNI